MTREERAETLSDRERWDRKYSAGRGPAHFQANPLSIAHRPLLTGGSALDVACGFGGNALYLASLGYRVDAVDASGVALREAEGEATRRGLALHLVQADLSRWRVLPARYDAVLVFNYMNRDLAPMLANGLRAGGLLFQAGRNRRFLDVRPDFDPAFLWELGELRRLVAGLGLDVLHYADGTPDVPHAVQLVARRPAT